MPDSTLIYRACSSIDDFHQCAELQRAVWGFDDVDVLPFHLFVVAHEIGGQNFGAFEPGGRMVGFVFALPGIRRGRPYFHSHMLGVRAEYRDRHTGRRLKFMQRDDALARGVALIEWTFDPLEPRNAFFNIERLGAIARRYIPNRYGMSTSALHAGLPTDRLVAEWRLDSPRVVAAAEARLVTPAIARRIEVPPDIGEFKYRERQRAYDIQQRLRCEFDQAFADGLAVTGFDKAGAYLLSKVTSDEN